MEDSSLRKVASSNIFRHRANSIALALGNRSSLSPGSSNYTIHDSQFSNPDMLGKSWNRGFSRK